MFRKIKNELLLFFEYFRIIYKVIVFLLSHIYLEFCIKNYL